MNISIILTLYNAEKYLQETLKSIAAQTYQHYEIVILDDGSTDKSVAIAKDFATSHPAINMTVHPFPHIGRAAALNIAVNKAQHDWIAIIDADDLWHKDKLQIQIQLIESLKLDFLATESATFVNAEDINTQSNLVAATSLPTKLTLNDMLYFNRISHSSVLGRKSLFKYNMKRKSQIDYDLWLSLLSQHQHLSLIQAELTYHRIHANQSFEAKNPFRYALRATLLQLKYCLVNKKLLPAIFVVAKFGYYLLPKRVRFFLRKRLTALQNPL